MANRHCGPGSICCLVSLFVLLLGLASAIALRFHSGLDLWEVHPVNGGSGEASWAVMHWIGLGNLAILWSWLPGYSRVDVAAPTRPGRSPRIALTFDDAIGLNESGAEMLLDLLDDHKAKASFFVIANEEYTLGGDKPATLKKVVSRGHEVGNHGLEDAGMSSMSETKVEAALTEWESRVESVIGAWPVQEADQRWFRPPQGAMSEAMATALDKKGYRAVLGDVICNDWQNQDVEYHVGVAKALARDGSVVILHVPDRPQRVQTIDVLRQVLPYLSAQGFEFVRLSELFSSHGSSVGQLDGTCEECMIAVAVACLAWALAILVSITYAVRSACRALVQKRLERSESEEKGLTASV